MCNNAMKYNGPDTIYYKSADKILSIGLKLLSKVNCITLLLHLHHIQMNVPILLEA